MLEFCLAKMSFSLNSMGKLYGFVVLMLLFVGCSNYKIENKDKLSQQKVSNGVYVVDNYQDVDSLSSKSDFGIWVVNRYVDEFGDVTDEEYITNSKQIKGSFTTPDVVARLFTNSSVVVTDLGVSFFIGETKNIGIRLLDDNANVLPDDNETYTITVKADGDQVYKLDAYNYEGKLFLSNIDYQDGTKLSVGKKTHNQILWDLLVNRTELKFQIHKRRNPATIYYFTIGDASGLDKAYSSIGKS